MEEPDHYKKLREKLKSLSNRYAVEILVALSPETGDIIPLLKWDEIIERIMENRGFVKPKSISKHERTAQESIYENHRKSLATGGTLYESMEKLVKAEFVKALGERGKKQRKYRITHEGRLALVAIQAIQDAAPEDSELIGAARTLLRFKNYVNLLPTQARFFQEIREVKSNLILQMPPGSGKTFLAMVLILTRLEKGEKCLYLTPYMSITRQFIDEYKELLNQLGYSVVRYDAQSDATNEVLEKTDLIVGIYESVLNAILNRRPWTLEIKLVIVDELTELGGTKENFTTRNFGNDRSCRLDLLITLLKEQAQIITLSSRFGKTGTVARWLEADVFRPNVRFMPDEYVVIADEKHVKISSSDGTHEYHSQQISRLDAIHEFLGDYKTKAILVVTGSRNDAEFYARKIIEKYPRDIDNSVIERVIGQDAELPAAERLRNTLKCGVAFHHAGLTTSLRGRLERELKAGTIQCVVSTTGITAGASFPFDCVAIMFGSALFNIVDRSRYLQIAGRIGEYYLAEHGGQVFLALPKDTSRGIAPEELASNLLHQPLNPIKPAILEPFYTCAIIIRELNRVDEIKRSDLIETITNIATKTLRGYIDTQYEAIIKEQAKIILSWMNKNDLTQQINGQVRLTKELRNVVNAGINPIDYIKIRKWFDIVKCIDESQLIDLVLEFRLVQASRPRTVVPTEVETKAIDLDTIDVWYNEQVSKRKIVKHEVLKAWINEEPIKKLITQAIDKGTSDEERPIKWVSLDEGDMITMVNWAADIADQITEFLGNTDRKELAQQFQIFSKRLRYGLKEDAAKTDLMNLAIDIDGQKRYFTRKEIRTLVDKGYMSIEAIVKKDIDRSKRQPARVRFTKNSGLERDFAKEVYKAAMAYIRRPLVDKHD